MHTELDSSQIEVQRCTLSWAAGEAWRRVGKVGKAEVEVEEAEARRTARRTAIVAEEEEEVGMRSDKI